MTTTERAPLADAARRAEVHLDDLVTRSAELTRYVDAVHLYGVPTLEALEVDEFRLLGGALSEALRQATLVVDELQSLMDEISILLPAAEAGARW